MPGLLVALIAKLAALGTVAKVAVATTTAALTMAVTGATGVLPLPGDDGDPAVVAQGALHQATAAVDSAINPLPPTTTGDVAVQAATGTSVTPPAGSASTGVTTRTAASASLPTVPNVTVPTTTPALPVLPSCVANLIPTGGTVPDPAQLIAQLPTCIVSVVTAHLPLDAIQSVIGSANLPVNVSQCLSSVLSSVPTFVSGDLSGLSQLLSACLPTGSIPGMDSLPGMGSLPGLGSLPRFGSGR